MVSIEVYLQIIEVPDEIRALQAVMKYTDQEEISLTEEQFSQGWYPTAIIEGKNEKEIQDNIVNLYHESEKNEGFGITNMLVNTGDIIYNIDTEEYLMVYDPYFWVPVKIEDKEIEIEENTETI